MVRKFFDIAPSEPGESAAAEPKVEVPVQGNGIAALMATQGKKSDQIDPALPPVNINKQGSNAEKQEQPETPAEPAKVPEVNAEVKQPETPTEQKVEVPEPQKAEEKKTEVSWQEVLKQQQPDLILKELGFDAESLEIAKKMNEAPKLKGLFKHWESKGDLTDYLREMSTDYSTMPVEDVMRRQLQREYPKASEKQLDVLFRKEILEKYNLDSDDPDIVEEGKLLLEAKAEKYREEFAKEQENFLIPPPPEKEDNDVDTEREQLVQSVTKQFIEDPYTKSVLDNKAIIIGDGDEKFTFPVDTDRLTKLALEGDTNGELMFDKVTGADGRISLKPKSSHQLLVATVNMYGQQFINELAKHYRNLGAKETIEPLENPSVISNKAQGSSAQPDPKNPAAAMAKKGVLVTGGG